VSGKILYPLNQDWQRGTFNHARSFSLSTISVFAARDVTLNIRVLPSPFEVDKRSLSIHLPSDACCELALCTASEFSKAFCTLRLNGCKKNVIQNSLPAGFRGITPLPMPCSVNHAGSSGSSLGLGYPNLCVNAYRFSLPTHFFTRISHGEGQFTAAQTSCYLTSWMWAKFSILLNTACPPTRIAHQTTSAVLPTPSLLHRLALQALLFLSSMHQMDGFERDYRRSLLAAIWCPCPCFVKVPHMRRMEKASL